MVEGHVGGDRPSECSEIGQSRGLQIGHFVGDCPPDVYVQSTSCRFKLGGGGGHIGLRGDRGGKGRGGFENGGRGIHRKVAYFFDPPAIGRQRFCLHRLQIGAVALHYDVSAQRFGLGRV